MSLQSGQAGTVESGKQLKRQLVAAACGLGVAVATLAGIGAWQTSMHQVANRPEHSPAGTVLQTAKSDSAQVTPGEAGTAYYIVGSQAQAESVRAELGAREAGKERAANIVLTVVDSPEAEARMLALIDAGVESANHGGPVPQIYDLRSSERR